MKTMRQILLALCLFSFSIAAHAQIKKIEYGTVATDTIDDAGTGTYALTDLTSDVYDLTWQVNITNISGTSDLQVILEASACASCSYFAPLDTVQLTAAKPAHLFVQNNFPGLRVRTRVIGTGTQSTQVDQSYYWRRRDR